MWRPHIDRLRVLPRPWVDTNINSRIQTVCNGLANQANLHDGIIAALLAHVEKEVLGVEGLSLLVGVVGRSFFDFPEEVLLNIELACVRDCAALDSVVGQELSTVMDNGLVGLVVLYT